MSGRTGARRHGRNAGVLRKQRSRPSEILGPALSMPRSSELSTCA